MNPYRSSSPPKEETKQIHKSNLDINLDTFWYSILAISLIISASKIIIFRFQNFWPVEFLFSTIVLLISLAVIVQIP